MTARGRGFITAAQLPKKKELLIIKCFNVGLKMANLIIDIKLIKSMTVVFDPPPQLHIASCYPTVPTQLTVTRPSSWYGALCRCVSALFILHAVLGPVEVEGRLIWRTGR